MGKCIKCGRKGMFLTLVDGICENCRIEMAHENKLRAIQHETELAQQKAELAQHKLSTMSASVEKMMEEAKTEAYRRLESDYKTMQESYAMQRSAVEKLVARRDALAAETDAMQKKVDSSVSMVKKLKELARSVNYSYEKWILQDYYLKDPIFEQIQSMDFDGLIPQIDLNCMTVKELKTRYTALRKQIMELYSSHESRYTTKANKSLHKLMVLAMEAEIENILYKLRFGRLEDGIESVKKFTAKCYSIVAEGNQSIAPTLKQFIGQIEFLYIEIVKTEYEYYVQRERAKEEQRALREQMRQEAEERKQLEQEKKKVAAEERKYKQEIERIQAEMQSAHAAELEDLKDRLAELTQKMEKVEEKKAEIVNLQNGKAGTIYVISNIGSFGENIYKIGMTRRLEPQDRINELGNASVPFPFDVHSFIFSEDAPALEAELHRQLNNRRVNKVNLRKEFFKVPAEELQEMVERCDPTAAFRLTALAEQYRQSLSISDVPDAPMAMDDEDFEDEG